MLEEVWHGEGDSARIAAATAILDWGYGRPTKTTSPEVNAPFMHTKIRLVAYTGEA
tara:strand:+ start:336 stop:503 length:168 start_codon:yes stop_codon:yes gene_type:complete